MQWVWTHESGNPTAALAKTLTSPPARLKTGYTAHETPSGPRQRLRCPFFAAQGECKCDLISGVFLHSTPRLLSMQHGAINLRVPQF